MTPNNNYTEKRCDLIRLNIPKDSPSSTITVE